MTAGEGGNSPSGCPLDSAGPTLVALMRRNFQRPRRDGSLPRLLHDKGHACLRGTFTVEVPSDPALRQGLFANPGSYPALVRFSNGFLADDRHPDSRGMAIKLTGVPGEVCDGAPAGQQDFLLIDSPRLPARDVAETLAYFQAVDGIREVTPLGLAAPSYLVPGFRPWRLRGHYLATMLSVAFGHLSNRSLSERIYHGIVPFRLGADGAMKIQCRPDAATAARHPRGRDLAERLRNALADGPIGFDFLIQPRQGEAESLELTGSPWTGAFHRVARLHLPQQPMAENAAAGDRIAFNPWNALRAHEPLGTINALRRTVYAASAGDRAGDLAFAPEGARAEGQAFKPPAGRV